MNIKRSQPIKTRDQADRRAYIEICYGAKKAVIKFCHCDQLFYVESHHAD